MLNGDVLTDIDLTAQLRQHESSGARVTLALIGVDDPSAYGLVRLAGDGAVTEFVEKPSPDEIDTNLVNAGRLHHRARDPRRDAAGRDQAVDRARRVPRAGGQRALRATSARGYWLDIGTPERYLQATLRHPRAARSAPRSGCAWTMPAGSCTRAITASGRDRPRPRGDRSRLRGGGQRHRRWTHGARARGSARRWRPRRFGRCCSRAARWAAARGSRRRSSARG